MGFHLNGNDNFNDVMQNKRLRLRIISVFIVVRSREFPKVKFFTFLHWCTFTANFEELVRRQYLFFSGFSTSRFLSISPWMICLRIVNSHRILPRHFDSTQSRDCKIDHSRSVWLLTCSQSWYLIHDTGHDVFFLNSSKFGSVKDSVHCKHFGSACACHCSLIVEFFFTSLSGSFV